jgi:hypothetical protein
LTQRHRLIIRSLDNMPSTKQIRLSSAVQIRARIKEFLGKKINIVLADNRVIIAELHAVSASGIEVINMRLKKNHYPFEQLYEVYFDVIV